MTSIFFTSPVKKNISERSLFPIVAADVLLSSTPRKKIIKNIRQVVDLTDEHFNALYQPLIDNFAEFVQLLPVNNESQIGSLIDQGLSRSLFALQLQKDADENQQPDSLFVYTLFSAALLFDVGFVLNDRTVMVSKKDGTFVKEWEPGRGKMLVSDGDYYRVRRAGGWSSSLSRRATPLLAQKLMPLAGFNWIAKDHDAFDIWISLLGDEKLTNDLSLYLDRANKKTLEAMPKEYFAAVNIDVIEPEETSLAEDFIEWLVYMFDADVIKINASDADVHVIEEGLFLEVPKVIQKFCTQSPKNPTWEDVFAQLKKIGFIRLNETSEQLAAYVYDYKNMDEVKPLPFMQESGAQNQKTSNEEQKEQNAKNIVHYGAKVLMPCFLSLLLAKHINLSIEKNFISIKNLKEKLKKKLKILKKLKLRRQRYEERAKEIEEAALLSMNLNKESLEAANKEFKKWLKKMQTPFYNQ